MKEVKKIKRAYAQTIYKLRLQQIIFILISIACGIGIHELGYKNPFSWILGLLFLFCWIGACGFMDKIQGLKIKRDSKIAFEKELQNP
jgi:hypothetical protein